MQRADFTHRVSATSNGVTLPRKSIQWISIGLLLIVGVLLTSWLVGAGIPSLFISPYPKFILIVPANYQNQPTSKLAAVFLDQRSHRTKSWFLTSQNQLQLRAEHSLEQTGMASQELGVILSEIIPIVDTEVTAQFRYQLLKTAVSIWNQPATVGKLVLLALLIPTPQVEEHPEFRQWGEAVARDLQPMELAAATCSIGVSNTTGQSGLGRRMADFLANQGAVIRRITDSEEKLVTTQVLIDQELAAPCRALQTELLRVLPANVPVTQQTGIFQEFRVPLVVLIGSDSAVLLTPSAQ